MLFKKYPFLLKSLLILVIGITSAYYLLYQQKIKESAVYTTLHEVEDIEQEDIYQLKLEYKRYKELPDFIFESEKLRILELGFNQLKAFDERLTKLPNLVELSLSGGMQSAKSWELLSLKRDLSERDSSSIYNQIEFLPNSIRQLTALKLLDLRNNRLKSIPNEIGELKALETLQLQGNCLKELPLEIGRLENLKLLDLYSNYLYRLPELFELAQLEKLQVFNNELIALPASIGKCKSLKYLMASDNQLEYIPSQIKSCLALERLDLKANKLHDLPSSIQQLESLKQLDLSYNLIDTLKVYFLQIPNLEELQLSNNHIEYLEADSLKNNSLNYLNLSHNQLSEMPKSLDLLQLEALVLSYNQFKKIPEFVYHLPNLQYLDIGYNQIEYLALEKLKAMPKLKELVIEGNPMNSSTTDNILNQLEKLKVVF
jgi:leucine-rich repeat protein SHOC2